MARKLLIKLFLVVCVATLAAGTLTANAAPLANGTILKIDPGVGSGFNTPCITGSCYSQELSPGFLIWTDILPGTDGGFIVGKSQASGGQEIDASSTADGELTAASPMGMALIIGTGTLYTLPDGGSVNVFDDASCTKLACIGKTALQTLNMAVNGTSVPMGSALGCTGPGGINCSPDQKAGIFVNSYNIDLVGKTWSMDYAQAVPSGPVSGVRFTVIFRGTVAPSNCPIVDYAWSVPGARSLMVFGSNLRGATSVMIDGVNAPVFQPLADDLLWVLPPDSVTWPWKPGTVKVTNANAGCSDSYPKLCVQ